MDAPAPAYLVTSEAHYPGWRAFIEGTEVPFYYTNVAFRGLPVPAGRHLILMRFSPPLLKRLAALSAAAWLATLGCLWISRRRKAGIGSSILRSHAANTSSCGDSAP